MATPIISLTELDSSTNNKYIVHNDALREIEALGLASVIDFRSTPPSSPLTGDTYLIKPPTSGVWVGQDNNIATYNGTGWDFLGARFHVRVYVKKLGRHLQYAPGLFWSMAEEAVNYSSGTNITATMSSEKVLIVDPTAANRTVTLPDPTVNEASFHIINTSTGAFTVTVRDSSLTTIRVLGTATVKSAWFYWVTSLSAWVASA